MLSKEIMLVLSEKQVQELLDNVEYLADEPYRVGAGFKPALPLATT